MQLVVSFEGIPGFIPAFPEHQQVLSYHGMVLKCHSSQIWLDIPNLARPKPAFGRPWFDAFLQPNLTHFAQGRASVKSLFYCVDGGIPPFVS